jgi:hypothetical protein
MIRVMLHRDLVIQALRGMTVVELSLMEGIYRSRREGIKGEVDDMYPSYKS